MSPVPTLTPPQVAPLSSVGSLFRARDMWGRLVSNQFILRVVGSGFSLPLSSQPPLSALPLTFPPPRDPARWQALQDEVNSLVEKKAIYPLSQPSPGFYSRLFTVPKKDGRFRPVLDLSTLNLYLRRCKFKMETPSSVRLAIRPNDWATSVDLQDAYFHILVAPGYRHLLRFVWEGTVFEFRALPFGLSLAPLIFTKVVKELAALVRAQGVRLRQYLDDWLTLAQSRDQCLQHTRQVLDRTHALGFQIQWHKSDLVPAQQFCYLGMAFDTVRYTVSPSPDRILSLRRKILSIQACRAVPHRRLAELLGSMESVALLLPLARLHKRPLQRAVADRTSRPLDYTELVQIGPWFHEAVVQWLDPIWLNSSVPIQPRRPSLFLYTDASTRGWGAHLDLHEAQGVWTQEESLLHINFLELEAVRRALLEFRLLIRDQDVLVHGDNTTCLAYLRHQGGTNSRSLSLLAEEILLWCQTNQVRMSVQFVPGKLNALADILSRGDQVLPTEWTIAHNVLQRLWARWDRPLIDLFATRFSARLPRYVSPFRDTNAFHVDAFTLSWRLLDAYAYPPTSLIPRVLAKYLQERPRLILVAPYWPTAPWFPDLRGLSHVDPLPLDLDGGSLLQPRSGLPHPRPESLCLTAWLLCAPNCSH